MDSPTAPTPRTPRQEVRRRLPTAAVLNTRSDESGSTAHAASAGFAAHPEHEESV